MDYEIEKTKDFGQFSEIKGGQYFFDEMLLYRKLHTKDTDAHGENNAMNVKTGRVVTFTHGHTAYFAEQTQPAKFRRVKGAE